MPLETRRERGRGTADQSRFDALHALGELVCLDFVNTVDPRVGDLQQDYLATYTDLVQWSRYTGALAAEQEVALLRAAAQRPGDAQTVFHQVIALRETLYRLFTVVATRRSPASADLAALHGAYMSVMAQAHLGVATNRLEWRWAVGASTLDQLLAPIVVSAVHLLTSPEARRIKMCPGLGDCGWIFLDTSKGGRRRWCRMQDCGSRAKMRRYYARRRSEQAGNNVSSA
jgi:predicted RNA-binding Zn ribbon-like protein